MVHRAPAGLGRRRRRPARLRAQGPAGVARAPLRPDRRGAHRSARRRAAAHPGAVHLPGADPALPPRPPAAAGAGRDPARGRLEPGQLPLQGRRQRLRLPAHRVPVHRAARQHRQHHQPGPGGGAGAGGPRPHPAERGHHLRPRRDAPHPLVRAPLRADQGRPRRGHRRLLHRPGRVHQPLQHAAGPLLPDRHARPGRGRRRSAPLSGARSGHPLGDAPVRDADRGGGQRPRRHADRPLRQRVRRRVPG